MLTVNLPQPSSFTWAWDWLWTKIMSLSTNTGRVMFAYLKSEIKVMQGEFGYQKI